ncbi:hypothetical protein ABW20_dc0101142 [Dactylellina cionopaga]|nr:hypothetical protein ABW20_dc0101142 [Dactylellina cionopaga]
MHVKYLFLAALPLITSAAPLGLDIVGDLLKDGPDKDLKVANGGPLGPGLSALVALAEGILRKYGITKTYADIADLDAGLVAIVGGILGVNGKEGIIGFPGKSLGGDKPKSSKLDPANQKIQPTDIYKPTLPAQEQDGIKFHNVEVVSFLPGVVDESWILAFGGKETHFGTKSACFSLMGPNLQVADGAVKARCLSKDISGEDKGSPEEEKKPLKEEKCPPLVVGGISATGKLIIPKPGAKAEKVPILMGCWGTEIPKDLLPKGDDKPAKPTKPIRPTKRDTTVAVSITPKYAILKFNGVLAQE